MSGFLLYFQCLEKPCLAKVACKYLLNNTLSRFLLLFSLAQFLFKVVNICLKIIIYLATMGLSCSTQVLQLQHANS